MVNSGFTMAFASENTIVAASYAPARAVMVATDSASSSFSTSAIQLAFAVASMAAQSGLGDCVW